MFNHYFLKMWLICGVNGFLGNRDYISPCKFKVLRHISINTLDVWDLGYFTLLLMSQGRYWLLTIPQQDFTPFQHEPVQFIRGQLERGNDTGYIHWQLLVAFKTKIRLAAVKRLFGDSAHCELSRSSAANEYVWKEDTRIEGTQFELGVLAFKRNSQTDWDAVLRDAKRGRLDTVPADIVVRWVFSGKVLFPYFE